MERYTEERKSPRPDVQRRRSYETPRREEEHRRRPSAAEQERKQRPASQRNTQKNRRKRGKRPRVGKFSDNRFRVRLLTTLALVAAIILCCIVFFRVSTISVTGNENYSYDEIVEASGIEESDALLLINKSAVASKIMAKLPYVDDVRIGTSFPNAVRIEVTELETAYAVTDTSGNYWLINSQGRVVEPIEGKAAADYLTVIGFQVDVPEPGQTIQASKTAPQTELESEDEDSEDDEEDKPMPTDTSTPRQKVEAALEILSYLETYNQSEGITILDVSNLLDIRVEYGTQYEIRFGGTQDLDYKVEYMLAAVSQLNDYESGTLDLTFTEERVARFIPWSGQNS